MYVLLQAVVTDVTLPLLRGSEGRLCDLGCGVPPPAVLGVAGTGEQVERLWTTLGDESHPGECHNTCVPILFHSSVEKCVGSRTCLPGVSCPPQKAA